MLRTIAAATIVALAGGIAHAQDDDPNAEARLACMNDVIRLCPDHMLNPDEARACMKTKKALVSPECAAFYPGGKRAGEVR